MLKNTLPCINDGKSGIFIKVFNNFTSHHGRNRLLLYPKMLNKNDFGEEGKGNEYLKDNKPPQSEILHEPNSAI